MALAALLLARGRDRLETLSEILSLHYLDFLLLARGRDRLETKLHEAGIDLHSIHLLLARGRDRLETHLANIRQKNQS